MALGDKDVEEAGGRETESCLPWGQGRGRRAGGTPAGGGGACLCRRDPCWPGSRLSSAVQSGWGHASVLRPLSVPRGPGSWARFQAGRPFLCSWAESALVGTCRGRLLWVPSCWGGVCPGQARAKEPGHVAVWHPGGHGPPLIRGSAGERFGAARAPRKLVSWSCAFPQPPLRCEAARAL